jgi:hypothetical protein
MMFAPCVAMATYRQAVPSLVRDGDGRLVPPLDIEPRVPAPRDEPAVARKTPVDQGATGSIGK